MPDPTLAEVLYSTIFDPAPAARARSVADHYLDRDDVDLAHVLRVIEAELVVPSVALSALHEGPYRQVPGRENTLREYLRLVAMRLRIGLERSGHAAQASATGTIPLASQQAK